MKTETCNLLCIALSVLTFQLINGSSSSAAATPPNISNSSTSCNITCGGVSIPYPFGIGGKDCYLNSWYEVVCKSPSGSDRNVPFLSRINKEVLNISFLDTKPYGVVHIKGSVASLGCQGPEKSLLSFNVTGKGSPYFITDENRLVAVGCGTKALITDTGSETLGCESSCENIKSNRQVTNSILLGIDLEAQIYFLCQTPSEAEGPIFIKYNHSAFLT